MVMPYGLSKEGRHAAVELDDLAVANAGHHLPAQS